jgi:hypothetical protein
MQIDIQIDHILRRESGDIEVSVFAEYRPQEKATHEVPAVPDSVDGIEIYGRDGRQVAVHETEALEVQHLLLDAGRRAVSERGEG